MDYVISVENTHQDTNQIWGQSVQAKSVNSKATDEALLSCNMAQQITAELWGAETENGKISVIT
jgi:hypothetical protein